MFGYVLIVSLLIIALVIIATFVLYYYQKTYSCRTNPNIRCYNDWTCPESPQCPNGSTGGTGGLIWPYCWAGTLAVYFGPGNTSLAEANSAATLCSFTGGPTGTNNPVTDGGCECAWGNISGGSYPLTKFCNPGSSFAPSFVT